MENVNAKIYPGLCKPVEAQVLDARFISRPKVTFDPKTGSASVDESDVIDLVAMAQTYKDQCGVEMAIKLIKTGQAVAEDFADDGKHGLDLTALPDNPQALAALQRKADADVAKLEETYGIPKGASDFTDEQLSALISNKVEEVLGAYIAKAANGGNE